MATTAEKLVVRSSTTVELARYTGDAVGTYRTIVPRGSVSINDGRGTQTYADFSSAMGAIATQYADGDRTVSVTFNTYLIPSDAAYTDAYDAYDDGANVALRITFKERVGNAAAVRHFRGSLNQFHETGNQDGAAEASISFVASSKIAPVTP